MVDVLWWFYIKEGSLILRCEALPVGLMVVGQRSEVRLLSDGGFGVERDEYWQVIRAERSNICPGDSVCYRVGGCCDIRCSWLLVRVRLPG